jgi:DNA-binding MarR family transcriptional regulator
MKSDRPPPGRPDDLSDAEYQALARFRRALRLVMHASEEAARAAGLTPAQHQLLLAVRGHPGPGDPSTSEVADVLQLRLHSAVELLQRTETLGLIARRSDPSDGRRQLVTLTPAGRARLAILYGEHRDELRRARSRMAEILAALERPRRAAHLGRV